MDKSSPGSPNRPVENCSLDRPIVSLKVPPPGFPWTENLQQLYDRYEDQPVELVRSRASRVSSLRRYGRAYAFFPEEAAGERPERTPFFYFAGISAQLALSSHLFNVGFNDSWCRRFIGLRVAKSLAYANATGFNCHDEGIAKLVDALSPYNKWNEDPPFGKKGPDSNGISADTARQLLRDLLIHVQKRTGHRRGTTWRQNRMMGDGVYG